MGGGLVRLVDWIYPIGSVVQSTNADYDPNLFFIGTSWTKIENKFLLGSGTKTLGSTGGSETHTLTVDEMPNHAHNFPPGNYVGGGYNYINQYLRSTSQVSGGVPPQGATYGAGGGLAHNNMPPYIVVNIWKRVA